MWAHHSECTIINVNLQFVEYLYCFKMPSSEYAGIGFVLMVLLSDSVLLFRGGNWPIDSMLLLELSVALCLCYSKV